MKYDVKDLILALLLILVNGCAYVDTADRPNRISVFISSATVLSYSGKGAGAGMALMATVGPVGAAIGVAIDEGIAKDIRQNIKNAGFDLKRAVCAELVRKLHQCHCSDDKEGANIRLILSEQLLTSFGENDLVRVQIKADVYQGNSEPSEWAVNNDKYEQVTLEDARHSGESVAELYSPVVSGIVYKLSSAI